MNILTDKKTLIILVLTILLTLSGVLYFRKTSKLEESKGLLSSIKSELIQKTNELGQEVSKREIIETYNSKMFTKMELQDSLLKELQKVTKENQRILKKGGSSTIVEGETKIDNSSVTNVFYKDSNTVYKSSFNDEWIEYDITARKDSTELNLKCINKYSIVLGSERQSLFKKRKPFATVTNYNPYTKTKNLRTYQVKMKPQRFTLGVQAGYGVTRDGLRGYVGVGGGYTIVRF